MLRTGIIGARNPMIVNHGMDQVTVTGVGNVGVEGSILVARMDQETRHLLIAAMSAMKDTIIVIHQVLAQRNATKIL